MSTPVEKIKEKLDIAEVIGSYIKIDRSGSNYKAKCPFHNEKTPSFFISAERGTYYCFGCAAKGDMFTFVQEFEGLDFMGALKVLATRAGVELVHENPTVKKEIDQLYSVLDHATLFFQQNLQGNTEAQAYLHKRGVTEKTIQEWRLGYVSLEWRSLYDFLKTKGFSDQEISKVGLIKRKEKGSPGNEFYDTFRGRVMFPIFDSSGRVIAFSGRILIPDEKAPKYLNSPETALFNKSEVLYGLHKAKTEIRKIGYSILVEGQMDLIMSHQAGCGNTVASSGTALTQKHLEKLMRISPKIIMAFDGDKAGFAATERGAEIALAIGMEVKVAELAEGVDPADLVLQDLEEWKVALTKSVHVIDFYLNALLRQGLDKRKLGKEIQKKVLPFVNLLQSSIEKAHFISQISKKADIKEDALWDDLRRVPEKALIKESELPVKNITDTTESPPSPHRKTSIERKIVGILYWQKSLASPTVDLPQLEKQITEVVGGSKLKELVEALANEKETLIFEIEAYYDKGEKLTNDIPELLLNFEKDYLNEEFTKAMLDLGNAERLKDDVVTAELLKKCQQISQKIALLEKKFNSDKK